MRFFLTGAVSLVVTAVTFYYVPLYIYNKTKWLLPPWPAGILLVLLAIACSAVPVYGFLSQGGYPYKLALGIGQGCFLGVMFSYFRAKRLDKERRNAPEKDEDCKKEKDQGD